MVDSLAACFCRHAAGQPPTVTIEPWGGFTAPGWAADRQPATNPLRGRCKIALYCAVVGRGAPACDPPRVKTWRGWGSLCLGVSPGIGPRRTMREDKAMGWGTFAPGWFTGPRAAWHPM